MSAKGQFICKRSNKSKMPFVHAANIERIFSFHCRVQISFREFQQAKIVLSVATEVEISDKLTIIVAATEKCGDCLVLISQMPHFHISIVSVLLLH